jgi:hypothetical protein
VVWIDLNQVRKSYEINKKSEKEKKQKNIKKARGKHFGPARDKAHGPPRGKVRIGTPPPLFQHWQVGPTCQVIT